MEDSLIIATLSAFLVLLVVGLVCGIVRDIRDAAAYRRELREAEDQYENMDGDGFGIHTRRK